MTTNHPYGEPTPSGEPQYGAGPGQPYVPPAPFGPQPGPQPGPQSGPQPEPQYYPYYDPRYAYDPQAHYGGYYPPVPPAPKKAKRRWAYTAGATAVVAAAVIATVAVTDSGSGAVSGAGAPAQYIPTSPGFGNGNSGSGNGGYGNGGYGNGGSGSGGSSGGSGQLGNGGTTVPSSVGLATSTQQKGVVTIVSVLKYQNAESAGTGMILTSDGEILTNNHVVDGATSITVTVASSGQSYKADVVGTDPTDDVAVIQLENASGLQTANLGDSSKVKVGDSVVGVGNAGGTGTLRASSGSVTALNQSITATDESGGSSEQLSGLIQVNAPIISGDSGGPLYNSSGSIVGMDTAASANSAQSVAYAIPIDTAVKIAGEIETKVETSKIHIGLPAFLGVSLDTTNTQQAVVYSLLDGGPAAGAGITAGSTVTSVQGQRVTTAASLKTLLTQYKPGNKVSIGWTDANGQSHTATVTLATGPAD